MFASGGLKRKQIRHQESKNDSQCHSHMFSRLIFQKFWPPAVYETMKEASYTLRMTLSAILISLQGLFFKKIRLRQFKKKASYALRMTLSAILIS